jgi:hypothetical protein
LGFSFNPNSLLMKMVTVMVIVWYFMSSIIRRWNCDGHGEGDNLFEKTNNRGKKPLLDCFLKSFQLRSSSEKQQSNFFANDAFANAWTNSFPRPS